MKISLMMVTQRNFLSIAQWVLSTKACTLIGNSTNLTMTGLVPFKRYTCCVRPQWIVNEGGLEVCAETNTFQDGD